jgi:DNA-binding response OmpR family regulator
MTSPTSEKPTSGTPVPRILVVDDEPEVRNLLREVLKADGYEILTAGDGKEALQITLKEKPDLITLDIRMPKLDGLTLCKALRVNEETRNIPIIMLTAYNTREHLEACMAAGADDFLAKPLSMDEIRIRVRAMLKLKNVSDEVSRLQQYILSLRETHGEDNKSSQT